MSTTTMVPAPRKARSPGRRRRRTPWSVYLVLLPLFVVLGLFAYYPAFSGIFHSFYEWNPGFDSTFTGLDNYRWMLDDDLFWSSFKNLGIIFIFGVTIGWIPPILAAELLISLRSARLQFFFRTLLIAPMAFPGVVLVLLWAAMYHPNDGVINRMLTGLGLDGLAHNWLGDPATALIALLVIGFPFIAGLPFLVVLTALQDIPREIFEAAELDGVGRVRRFFAIDLPLLTSQFKLLVFLTTIGVLQYGFAAYLTTGGGPDHATEVPVLRLLAAAFTVNDWGYAAALSTVLFLMALALSVVIVKVRKGEDSVRSL